MAISAQRIAVSSQAMIMPNPPAETSRSATPAEPRPRSDLPRVLLLGDSIRLGYAQRAAALLAGTAVVASPTANGGDSANVLRHLSDWLASAQPEVVHFNCGLHDLKRDKVAG